MVKFFMICLGGAIGTGARYLISGWALRIFGSSFPYGTLTVNLLGSFLIGVINYIGLNSEMISPTVRIFLTIGVMGGFTTYSSFNYETLQYLQEGIWFLGILNLLVMVFSCLMAGILGFIAAKWILGS
jgi:CrcB protein